MSIGVRVDSPAHSHPPTRVPYSGSANRDCRAATKPQIGPGCPGGRCPPAGRGLDIAAAALTAHQAEGVEGKAHSEGDPRPDSIPDIVRSNPADGVARAVVQGAVMESKIPASQLHSNHILNHRRTSFQSRFGLHGSPSFPMSAFLELACPALQFGLLVSARARINPG